jgi:hypothetical protein
MGILSVFYVHVYNLEFIKLLSVEKNLNLDLNLNLNPATQNLKPHL